ncbi:DUF4837 family protein [Flavobacterium granuli]|uniref:Uncharacterized protein DUF4837 n=1 Tax=Flavobacterium granuli TaxID=280093 RepID=A0A1M5KA91_9FLAO|nr:DUF4837 family protein [Flavobacterium granuli]PRZ26210.1 uncharacterized protein DUF4837 [Flavobacterium granuli]SHG49409.1 protein of unknown function [Flavobacterium granuli]
MNKTHFLYLFISLLLFSCKKEDADLPKKTAGKINSISVIVDDLWWNGEIGDNIRNKFASPVIGLPQEEPLFTINQYPVKLMEGFMTDCRNIIVIKKGNENKFQIKENQCAAPQNVFHITGKTAGAILEILEKNSPKMIQIIHQTEIAEKQRLNRMSLMNAKAINNKFKIKIEIPSSYEQVLQKDNFIWLKKEIVSGNTSLLIYQLPLNSFKKGANLVSNVIKIRDSIGHLYIHGKEANTDMMTEEAYAPYFFKIKQDGKLTYETKGTWEVKNDFMSGPFVNYAIVDEEHDRLLVLEGFCYSPSKEKRDLMHELESIIKSVSIVKN